MNRLRIIPFLLLAACELEEATLPLEDDPSVLSPEVEGCPALDFVYCRSGYVRDFSRDGERVFCRHVLNCPVLRNPCLQGTSYGDPAEMVLCEGAP